MAAWLLHQKDGETVGRILRDADLVVASDLTLVECDRVLIRAETEGAMTAAQAGERRRQLREAAAYWIVLRLVDEIVQRARRPFPEEPIRTLDALHLACLLHAQAAVAPATLLCLDQRLSASGRALGFPIVPDPTGADPARRPTGLG